MAQYRGFYEMVLKHLVDSPFRGKLKWEIHSGGQDVTFDLDRLTLSFNRRFDDAHPEVIALETACCDAVAQKHKLGLGGVGMYVAYVHNCSDGHQSVATTEERDKAYKALSDACEDYFSLRLNPYFDRAATTLKEGVLRSRDILLVQEAAKQAKLLLEKKY